MSFDSASSDVPASSAMIRLRPLYMERVWGGRELESVYGRQLPAAGVPYGESWEVVDRPDEQSVVTGGAYVGKTLHELWTQHRAEIFGAAAPESERFPLLIKILDARDTLSLQVHPPASEAAALQGEPKTEMWVITGAEPGACLYAGVTPGTTRETLAAALADGTAAGLVPQLPAREGDFIFIPSGRLHAIGAGLLIFEIQQNSDTTYRVFDWNRMGLDGKPRQLHVEESLRCIDFADTAPALGTPDSEGLLASCEYFTVHRRSAGGALPQAVQVGGDGGFLMIGMLSGIVRTADGAELKPGDWALVPASAKGSQRQVTVSGTDDAAWLEVGF
ncbi:MAG: mannose-6-phosphate isomerase [Verrucomicrobiales bacterium]|nr:mannose-6-phosphate isomerase [Verrucomicrobiales bacterium]